MLTPGKIKKGCEVASGFEYCNGWMHHGRFKFSINNLPNVNIDLRFKETIYPLFLTKVIEGINNGTDYEIITYGDCVRIYPYDNEYDQELFIDLKKVDSDQAKEQAINYVFDKMEGVKCPALTN